MNKLTKLLMVAVLFVAVLAFPARSYAAWTIPVWAASSGFKIGYLDANYVGWGLIAAACIWHIPAWDKAKEAGTEVAYQKQEMWPQQWFDNLPGGTPGRQNGDAVVVSSVASNTDTNATSGYWESKVLASNK